MTLLKKYNHLKDRWWALPLVVPAVLFPLFSLANTFASVSGQHVILYYLPMALLISLMMFFGWAALPGIIVALLLRYGVQEPFMVLLHILRLLIPVVLSWGGYRVFVTRRHCVSYGSSTLISQRVFWQVLCPATILLIILEMGVWLNLYDQPVSELNTLALNMPMLINY
ncbi:Cytochrome C-type biogenesis protein [Kosakonia sp. BK9b]